MKRFAWMIISTCTVLFSLFTTRSAICADTATGQPAAVKEASPPTNKAAEKVEKKDRTKSDEILISLKAPLFSPLFAGFPIAKVDDDQITLAEFTRNLDALHKNVTGQEAGHKKSFSELLDRLISVKLIVEEARRMELDQQPEIKSLLAVNKRVFLKQALYAELLKGVKPDEKEVGRVHAELQREVKLQQVEFGDAASADKFAKELRGGKKFAELVDKAVTDGVATVSKSDSYIKVNSISPSYQKVLARMKTGETSPVVKNLPKFVVLKLDDLRNSDDPSLLVTARAQVLAAAKNKILEAERALLFKKFLRQNTKLIKSLDIEATKPGIDRLLNDKRVLVTVQGEKPITVGDLIHNMRASYTHGFERAIKEKKANAQIVPALKEMMSAIVIRKEALARGLDKSSSYKEQAAQDEESTLFGAFIELALKPEIKIGEKDVQAYYDAHQKEFSTPEKLKMKSLAFMSKDAAQKAVEKLRQGIDLKWLATNADDQVPEDSPGILVFGDREEPLAVLPEGLQKAVSDAKSGEYRIYDSPEGYHYVLYIENVSPARQQTLGEAANELVPATYNEKFKQLLGDWNKKLREAADVTVYADF